MPRWTFSPRMPSVFLLWHSGSSKDVPESLLIGVYSNPEKAKAAKARLADIEGYRDWPDGFLIDEYELDKDHWTEGFVTE